MNWMIYPAARAFIKVCAVLFGAGAAAAILIHLFMPFFPPLSQDNAPFLLLGTGAEFVSILSPVLPHVLGRQSPAGLPAEAE